MKKLLFLILCTFILLQNSKAQEKTEKFEEAIEDNSYFIEESYNQEPGVVQHYFSGLYYSKPSQDVYFSFTQEWPLSGIRHQISYSIPYNFLDHNNISGVGDILINYRYQLFCKDDWAACAPRFSIILPTGNSDKGLGNGTVGFQTNIPVSKRFSQKVVTHFNAGMTLVPGFKGKDEYNNTVKRTLSFFNIGASIIWLENRNFNLMLEYLTNLNSNLNNKGEIERSSETIISPGIRFAIEIESAGLEIVPGFAFPYSMTSELNRTGMYFYLSFEHPF
jgi:hypothetical protein